MDACDSGGDSFGLAWVFLILVVILLTGFL
jgi:hypothetical protein